MSANDGPRMSASELNAFLETEFPQMQGSAAGRIFVVEEVWRQGARMRMKYRDYLVRPGGTISGPAMFTLADLVMYAALLGCIGPVKHAVTSNLSISFLRRPEQRDMIADAKLLKVGKRLAFGEIALYSEHEEELAAHATATYSVPPDVKW